MLKLTDKRFPQRILNDFRLRRGSNILAVEIHADVGFFAQLNWCLYMLAYCGERGLTPRIRLTGAAYANIPGQDWFHDYFVEAEDYVDGTNSPEPMNKGCIISLSIGHINETRFASRYEPSMTIEHAHQLFTSSFQIKSNVEEYVNDFVTREFVPHNTIGLHFRGTDKKVEAESVDWSRCVQSVRKYASEHPETKKVFVSSDDALFLEWFSLQIEGDLTVVSHPDVERSRDGKPVHGNAAGSGYTKGFEALVNCLLLSRCNALIRTASFLSGWSSVFNPNIPVTLLNEPFEQTRWFPDRELIRRSDNRYR